MNNRINIISAVCIIALLSACSETDIIQPSDYDNLIELQAEICQQYTTRANDGGFADGDQIGVFIVNYNNDEAQSLQPTGNHADNVRYTYDEKSGKWTGSYQLYWKDKNTPVDAYGYYPFDANLNSITAYAFSVQHNQRDNLKSGRELSGYEASDFLWAKKEGVIPTVGAVTLQHHHLMAGVKVVLTEGDGFDAGEWDNIEKTVIVENTLTQSTINLQTGAVKAVEGSVASIIPQQQIGQYRAVVVPQTVSGETKLFSFTIDGKSTAFTRQEPMIYYPGKLHQFTFSVQKLLETGDYVLTLLTESITPWENDTESHHGTAREFVTVHVNKGQFLGDVIKQMGLDPAKIVNLKLTGVLTGKDEWVDGDISDANFCYIRDNMPLLEALNMKELRTQNMRSYASYGDGSWTFDDRGEPLCDAYGQPIHADDYIPSLAFCDVKTLAYVTWPDSLKGIGDMAFAGTNLRGSLILPEGLKHIGGCSFVAYGHNTTQLTGELYIPSSVEYIGDGAFGSWDGRQAVYFQNELILPEHMKYLGDGAFTGCSYMTGTIHIPDGLTEVHASWPSQITGSAIVPQGVTKVTGIGCGAMELILPEGVKEIGNLFPFSWQPWLPYDSYRKRLRRIVLPKTLRTIGEQAFAGTGITHINIPEGIEVIPPLAFRLTDLQDTLLLPSSITKIEHQAFHECSKLEAVIFPANLGIIEEFAFSDCYSLNYIQCLGMEPPMITDHTFSGVEKDNFTVVVPEGAVEAYKNAPYWCEFKRISAYRNFVCRPMRAKLLNKSNVRDIILNADEAWTVKECPSWIHLDKTSGYKKTELKATIAALAHGAGDREGNVVFQLNRKDEDGNPITCTFQVQQYDYEIDEDAVVTFQTATKGQRGGIDILFVGDGYDAEDIARGIYRSDMEQEMEYFFGVEPYKTYRDYFNVHAAMAMSYESGVVDSPDKWRNTKFGITYGAGENGRLLVDFDGIAGYVLGDVTACPVTNTNISRSLVICVPNSDAYEGVTCMYADGSAIAVCPHSTWDYPNDARGLIQHEAGGHGWGKLYDEYIYHRALIQTCPCPCCSHVDAIVSAHAKGWGRNLSLDGKYKNVPWTHLIFDPRYGDIVDIYEGGYMHSNGIYRSEYNSCMNNNVPYFSTWSRQLIVERILWVAGETFDFETFVSKDSREMGDKFLTRGSWMSNLPDAQVQAVHSEHHGPVIKNGSPTDYVKKNKRR